MPNPKCPYCNAKLSSLRFEHSTNIESGKAYSDENFNFDEKKSRNTYFYCSECETYLGEYNKGFSVNSFFENGLSVKLPDKHMRISKEEYERELKEGLVSYPYSEIYQVYFNIDYCSPSLSQSIDVLRKIETDDETFKKLIELAITFLSNTEIELCKSMLIIMDDYLVLSGYSEEC